MKEKLFLWVLLVLVGTCLGRFVVEKKCLRVISASDSFGDVYECAIDNIPQYAGTMVGTVIYPRANQKACRAFDDVGVSFKSRPGGLPVFLLADRGDCFFALKAWRAQEAGAAAILLADDIVEPLITMYTPEEESIYHIDAIANITIPTALISKAFGNNLKKALWNGDMVNINLNWTESVPLPNEKVEYEFWTNSNYECGPQCQSQIEFIKNFKGVAQALEQKGYIKFTPHYITWYCPEAFVRSRQCRSQCINRGRYCALDPDWETSRWYEGKDIVFHNLMQACLYKIAGESGKPWLWWDYVTDFSIRCSMKKKKYNKGCADNVIQSLGIDLKKIDECLGDINADVDIPILKAEQDAQISKGSRGDVTMLPTLVINNRQYRGKLDKGAVLKAICAGFQETAKPSVCSSDWIETNERLENSGGRWQDEGTDITASMIEEKASAVEESVTASDKFTVKIMREDEAGSRNKISDRYVIIDMDDTEVPNSVSDTIPQSIIRKVLGILHI